MLKKILYTLWLVAFAICVITCIKSTNIRNFLSMMENRTFDVRQSIMAQYSAKHVNNNIVIVAIDDASYEYVLDKYGEWPLPRDIYVKIADYIESFQPKSIAFDLMFVKSIKSSKAADDALADLFKQYDNIFAAMNLDNQDDDLRRPPELPDSISVKVTNNSPTVDLNANSYVNCRKIIDGILNNTKNIGMTNVVRSDDGVLRKMPVFLTYNGKQYPQLGFAVGMHYLKSKGLSDTEYIINPQSKLVINDKRKIALDNSGNVILNWYGTNGSYEYIPMYKLIQSIENNDISKYDFKDKIVYVGTTASSLFDIKTVPVSKNYPGVEVQATYVNNMIDNNFIRHLDRSVTVEISILLALITILIVLSETSAIMGAFASISVYIGYLFLTYIVMRFFNIWLDVVYPLLASTMTLITAYMIKYFIKSRDFDKQYMLATTDGLTELYNHRYFKEQMRQMIDSSTRYGTQFSLIILDIDFFKKFNDTFGHQAGDAVLRQVAQTLKRNVRASDIVCRYGGEEMSIILANTNYDIALSTAQKICKRVSTRNFKLPHGKETTVTISLGVSTFPQDGISVDEIIEAADKRLYHAKSTGRNKVGD